MMTIKHIDAGGHEEVVSLVSASFDPETNILIGHGVACKDGLGELMWTQGRAFLMNEQGKTVAVYNLDSSRSRR